MEEEYYRELASQLRQPHGDHAPAIGEWMNRGNIRINLDTIAAVKALPGTNILEIGMGNGFFIGELFKDNTSLRYTGCDFSELMVQEAQRLNAEFVQKGLARFIDGNASALPFPSYTFHTVYTVNTLYFWDEPTAIAGEIKRVLQPGGHLVLTIRPKRLMKNYPFTQYGFTMYDKEAAVQLLKKNGFTITSAVENHEPDFEVNGVMVPVENIIVVAAATTM
ncbi:MAG: class I SAM-dependent methyltransferase [Bacteroidetes bacterium]|nr:class I SAM-dependent methyltransferase [Bacteroidota bacterium]